MNTQNKTRKVAVMADGTRHIIRKGGGYWHWKPGACSSHLDNLKHCVKAEGGTVITEPNPDYREPTGAEILSRQLGRIFSHR